MTTATSGTGTITLGSPSSNFQSFAAAGLLDGDNVRYTIEDGLDWEIGLGVYTSSGSGATMSRTLTSSSTGSLLSLDGSAVVYVTLGSEDIQEEFWIQQNATYTLTSSTAAQKLFNASTNGTLTLPIGTYRYEAIVYLTTMSATSGNGAFGILGAGTATVASALSMASGIDAAIGNGAAVSGSTWVGVTSNAAIVTAAGNTALSVLIRGTFRVSVAGTIIPSFTLTTAAAAVVQPNTYFMARRISDSATATTYGPWS
jgi:hypothetical protein